MSEAITLPNEYSWKKVLLWAFLFYFVWNWKSMALVYNQGVLPGPDDFLRLHQVQNWLAGQGWYDLTAYRMSPITGSDIHWSRLVDVPIAVLIVLFKFLMDPVAASRMAAIIWPLALFMIAITSMIAICDRLAGKQHRLMALFFFVLSINTMAEFRPGRLDHHNIQIVLLILIMLGISRGLGKYSNYWVGLLMSLSIVIGLDSVLLIIAALGIVAFDWALNKNGSAKRLFEIGVSIGLSSVIFYAISTTPSNWLHNNACDAYSTSYVSALVLLAIAFIFLATVFRVGTFPFKIITGSLAVIIITVILFYTFPHCLDGPLGTVSPELQTQWLDNVTEAKGVFERMKSSPSYWITQSIYLGIMLAVTLWVVIQRIAQIKVLAILGFIVLICILGAFYQTRILRTGIYSVIPFCVIFVSMSWDWLSERFKPQGALSYFAQVIICLFLTSTFWLIVGIGAGSVTGKLSTQANQQVNSNNIEAAQLIECTSELAMSDLMGIKPSHIISDLNTSTALLVHTPHSVEAGSYHRNGESILNVLSFFEGTPAQSKKIANKGSADFVVLCREDFTSASTVGNDVAKGESTLVTAIVTNKLPIWLEWVSNPSSPLAILKVVR